MEWLCAWDEIPGDCEKLSKETFTVLWITCYGFQEVADYCLSELGLNYMLLGKSQTDSLDTCFGQYHQLSGGKYNISLQQIYESEKKLRLLSTLKLKDKETTLANFDWNDFVCIPNYSSEQLVLPCDDDFLKVEEYLPVITYIAGYVCFAINKKLKCIYCESRMTCCCGDVPKISFFY